MDSIFKKEDYSELLKGMNLVEIGGDSCANCLAITPFLKEIAESRGDMRFVYIDALDGRDLITKWEITKVPTVVLSYNGEAFAKVSGGQPKEILEIWIDAKMEEFIEKQK